MMSLQETISNYWQVFFIVPLGFVSHKLFSLNAAVKVHEVQIAAMQKQNDLLCQKLDRVADQLQYNSEKTSELIGRFDEHLRR